MPERPDFPVAWWAFWLFAVGWVATGAFVAWLVRAARHEDTASEARDPAERA